MEPCCRIGCVRRITLYPIRSPVFKTGVGHMSTQDDVYEGYHLTKGSILIPNIWYAMPLLAGSSLKSLW